jgi:tetratricopeptide (TPR) repeat protein
MRTFAQQPPKEFFDGLDLLSTDHAHAKQDFQAAIQKAPQFHGSYHFLGVLYLYEHKPDSAIANFIKSIALNDGNVNHTREMAYVRLINTYTQQQDFQDAFKTGCDAYNLYPDSRSIFNALKETCLWSYYIKHNQLDPAYLSADIKQEYVVKSIDEEYLILHNLRVDDHYLAMNSQSLVSKNGHSYDVLKCVLSNTEQSVEVNFRIDWDMNVYFGGMPGPTREVIDNTQNPVYERVGAMLVSDNKTDLKEAIKKLLK